jgi:hypothetical protein
MMLRFALLLFGACILGACNQSALSPDDDSSIADSALEQAAIETGIIPDPATLNLEGLYEAGTELENDRFCAVQKGDSYNVGVFVYYGGDQICEGRGEGVLDGEIARLTLRASDDDASSCELEVVYDGTQIVFPGAIPDTCKAICTRRASLAGVSIPLVESGGQSALRARGNDTQRLCSG